MSMTERRYEPAHGWLFWVGVVGIAVLFGSGLWSQWTSLRSARRDWFDIGFMALWLVIAMYIAYRTLTSVKVIIIHEGDEIEFVRRIGRRRLMAADIRSVQVLRGKTVDVVIRHSGGKLYLGGLMQDFNQFVFELKQANPAVQSIGC